MDPVLSGLLRSVMARVLGLGAAALPRRYWRRWEGRVVVEAMAQPSAMLTVLLGFLGGLGSFLAFAARMADTTARLLLQTGADHPEHVTAPLALSAVAFWAWLLSPGGLFCGYLVLSGTLRYIGATAEAPLGDPLLTLADTAATTGWRRYRHRRDEARRNALEGPAVPDVLVRGADLGLAEDYALLASRLKADWEPGVFVVTPTRWYRIGRRLDRTLAGRLRAVYPLSEIRDLSVLRRSVACELPRLSALDRASGRTSLLPEDAGTEAASPLRDRLH